MFGETLNIDENKNAVAQKYEQDFFSETKSKKKLNDYRKQSLIRGNPNVYILDNNNSSCS